MEYIMRKIFSLYLFAALLGLCGTAFGQNIVVTGVNYGNGNVVVESSGTASPGTTCIGLARYIQTTQTGNATWQCVAGTWYQQIGSGGTVTSVTFGTLAPLFTTSNTGTAAAPILSFALSNAAQNSVFAGPATGGAGVPSYQTAPTFSAVNLTNFPTFNQSTTGTAAGLSGSQTANYFYAAPNGAAGTGVWRAIVAADIPILNQSTTGNAATASTAAAYSGNAHGLDSSMECVAGSGNMSAYTCATSPSFTPAVGDTILFRVDVSSNASATLAVNGGTAYGLAAPGQSYVLSSQVQSGNWYVATLQTYSATFVWALQSASYVSVAEGGLGQLTGTPSAGNIPIAQSGTSYSAETISGDCTLTITGAITCTKSSGVSFGTGAFVTIANYAALASPALTGAPTAPTQAAGDASTDIATDAFVQAAITVGGATAPAYTTCSSTCAVNLASGRTQIILLSGSPSAMTFTNGTAGLYTFVIAQNSTGGYALTWPTGTRGGGTISSAAGTSAASTVAVQSFVYVPSGAITTAAFVAAGAMTFGN